MENKCITLSSLNINQIAWIKSINIDGTMRRRLQDLGIIPKTKIKCEYKIRSGSPIAYFVRGTLIALRSEDTNRILVTTSSPFE